MHQLNFLTLPSPPTHHSNTPPGSIMLSGLFGEWSSGALNGPFFSFWPPTSEPGIFIILNPLGSWVGGSPPGGGGTLKPCCQAGFWPFFNFFPNTFWPKIDPNKRSPEPPSPLGGGVPLGSWVWVGGGTPLSPVFKKKILFRAQCQHCKAANYSLCGSYLLRSHLCVVA